MGTDDFDDEYENCDSDINEPGDNSQKTKGKEDLDSIDITDLENACRILSDDVKDEFIDTDERKMKCLSCGHKFTGEYYDDCPECSSSDTKEI